MSLALKPVMNLIHIYADDSGETHLGTTEIALPLKDFAPPATPFNASEDQDAKRYVIISLPVGWVGEQHT